MRCLRHLVSLAAVLVASLAAHCGGRGDGSADRGAEETRLYAAASLADAVAEIARDFEAARGVRVVTVLGSSATLAQQIREGARPGVFVAASADWADRLDEWGLAEPGTRTDLLGNSLVVVVPRGAPLRPAALGDLADPRYTRIAVADPAAVPAGRYATKALDRAGVLDSVRSRLVAAQDVRAALAWVERGEAPAGLVYATDAAASERVDVALSVPGDLHPPVTYPMVLVKGADGAARDLYAFLGSPAARAVFARFGFTRPPR